MSVFESLNRINNRFQAACKFHAESASLFWFLALPGFAMLHEWQCLTEGLEQRKIERLIVETCGIVPKYDSILHSRVLALTKNTHRMQYTATDKWGAIKQAWADYRAWEEETIDEYSAVARDLLEGGYVAEYEFVADIVQDVNEELTQVDRTILLFSGCDWDSPTVAAIQGEISADYRNRLKKLDLVTLMVP